MAKIDFLYNCIVDLEGQEYKKWGRVVNVPFTKIHLLIRISVLINLDFLIFEYFSERETW